MRHAGHQFAHGGQPVRLHEPHAQLALLRHVTSDEEDARRIRFGQPAGRERDDTRGSTLHGHLHLDARRRSRERGRERRFHGAAVRGQQQLDERLANDLVRLDAEHLTHRIIGLANAPRGVQYREHGIGCRAEQRAKSPLGLLHRLEQLGVGECHGQQVCHGLHALELQRRERMGLRGHDDDRAHAFAAPLHRHHGHAAHRIDRALVPGTLDCILMVAHVGHAPAAAGSDDTPHRGTSDGNLVAGQRRKDAARRGELDHRVVGEQAKRGAIRLRHVGRCLEEAVEHPPRIQLERDLLPQPPHAVQHALRIIELECSLRDPQLQRRLEQLLGRDAAL